MAYIGKQPAKAALTASDIADGIISEAKMADDAISLTELKAGTDGEVISWDASGNPVAIAAGTSGHFLKSQGAGSQPVFAAASSGLTKLASTTTGDATSAAITFGSSYITSTYDLYLLSGWCIPADDGAYIRIRVQSSGSDDTTATGYGFENVLFGGDNHANDNDESYIRTKSNGTYGGTNTGEGWYLNCWINNPLSSSYPTMIWGTTSNVNQDHNHEASMFSGCRYESANNGITVYWDTGNHDTGSTLTLYGVTK